MYDNLLSVCSLTFILYYRLACTPNKPCGICEARDCDSDDDCKKNFICADQHKAQLLKRGLNQFKGRCNNTIPSGWEVCIPPKWLVPAKKECEVDWYVGPNIYDL